MPAAQASATPTGANERDGQPAQPEKPEIDPAVLAELSPAGNPTVSAHPKGQQEAPATADAAPAPVAAVPASLAAVPSAEAAAAA